MHDHVFDIDCNIWSNDKTHEYQSHDRFDWELFRDDKQKNNRNDNANDKIRFQSNNMSLCLTTQIQENM